MVTRSHLQLVQPDTPALDAWRARLAAAAGPQHALIERALDFAAPLYARRMLAGGRPLLTHVLDVAQTLSELKLDADTLAAALLYPAYESSPETGRKVREQFGVT